MASGVLQVHCLRLPHLLKALQATIGKKLLIMWNRFQAQRSKLVRTHVEAQHGRILLEYLPPTLRSSIRSNVSGISEASRDAQLLRPKLRRPHASCPTESAFHTTTSDAHYRVLEADRAVLRNVMYLRKPQYRLSVIELPATVTPGPTVEDDDAHPLCGPDHTHGRLLEVEAPVGMPDRRQSLTSSSFTPWQKLCIWRRMSRSAAEPRRHHPARALSDTLCLS